METRANYVLVGACTLLALVVFAIIIIYSFDQNTRTDSTSYQINFTDGVSGLSTGNPVLLNGVRVGQVATVSFDDQDPSIVRVIVSVATGSPIRTDSVARLEVASITGLSSIYISGGKAGSPMLATKNDNKIPIITSGRSSFEDLLAQAPDLVTSANQLILNAQGFLSTENAKDISETLKNLNLVSQTLADNRVQIAEIINNLNTSTTIINKFISRVDVIIDKNIVPAAQNLATTLHSINTIVSSVDKDFQQHAGSGFANFSNLMSESRLLVRNLDGLVQKMSADPQMFILGDSVPTYNPATGK